MGILQNKGIDPDSMDHWTMNTDSSLKFIKIAFSEKNLKTTRIKQSMNKKLNL